MSQIRVRALKGEGKTVSKKARKSGRASGTASPAGSDALQRVFHQDDSIYRSESEETPPGTPPVYEFADGYMTPDDRDRELPAFDVKKLISELQDRKTAQSDTREILLDHYIKMLRNRYNSELDDIDTGELTAAFIRGANRGATIRERSLSLEAYSLTILLDDLDKVETSRTALKQILTSEEDEDCKITALHALTLTIVHYGGGDDDTCDYLDLLVEAIESNGEPFHAINKDGVMVALLECWAYAATHVESIKDQADYSLEAFVDKLDSADVETQTAAAECIAYTFEASRDHKQKQEEEEDVQEGELFQLPYEPERVVSRIQDLAKESAKSVSKKSRRDAREALRSVVTSLEREVGPYYSTVVDLDQYELGYRYKLRKGGGSSSLGYSAWVDSWHLFHRISMLRNIFGSGLERHIEFETPTVIQCLEGLDWHFVIKTQSRGAGASRPAYYSR